MHTSDRSTGNTGAKGALLMVKIDYVPFFELILIFKVRKQIRVFLWKQVQTVW